MLGVANREELVSVVSQLKGQLRDSYLPHWEFDHLQLAEMTGVNKLGTVA
jgi:hypothetical protein